MKPEFFSENKKKQFLSKLNIPEVSSKGSLFFFFSNTCTINRLRLLYFGFRLRNKENEPISSPTRKCALEMAF